MHQYNILSMLDKYPYEYNLDTHKENMTTSIRATLSL